MLTLPSALVQEKNKMDATHPWLVLLDIELNSSHKFYFVHNEESVTFGGQTYTAFPFKLDADEQKSSGEMPTLQLSVARDLAYLVDYWLDELGGAVDGRVTIRVVHTNNLAASYTDLTMKCRILHSGIVDDAVVFTLGGPNPLRDRHPEYRFMANHCNWVGHFKGLECGYSGAQTTCDGSWERCNVLNNTARFGGHRGLSMKGWRIA